MYKHIRMYTVSRLYFSCIFNFFYIYNIFYRSIYIIFTKIVSKNNGAFSYLKIKSKSALLDKIHKNKMSSFYCNANNRLIVFILKFKNYYFYKNEYNNNNKK